MIRLAEPSEIQKILSITKACAAKMTQEGIYQWNEHYPNIQAFENDLIRQELFVLIKEDCLIGCITVSTLKDEEYHSVQWLTKDCKHYYIHRLAIDPSSQRQGHAKALMDFVESKAMSEEVSSIRLDTFSKNLRNQKFYEARGYRRLDSIYFPKQSPFPFFCYEKVLSNERVKNVL